LNPDNVFRGCDSGIRFTGGIAYLNHGCLGWYEDCDICHVTDAGAVCDDGSIRNWIDGTVNTYVDVRSDGRFLKTAHAIRGVTGKNTFTGPVVYLNGRNAVADCFNSTQTDVLPDAGYFRSNSDIVSLTDYVANGRDTLFGFSNRIVG